MRGIAQICHISECKQLKGKPVFHQAALTLSEENSPATPPALPFFLYFACLPASLSVFCVPSLLSLSCFSLFVLFSPLFMACFSSFPVPSPCHLLLQSLDLPAFLFILPSLHRFLPSSLFFFHPIFAPPFPSVSSSYFPFPVSFSIPSFPDTSFPFFHSSLHHSLLSD